MKYAGGIRRKQSTAALINGIQEETNVWPSGKSTPAAISLAAVSLRLTRTSRQNFSLQNPSPPHRQIVHSDKGNLISSRDNPWSLSKHRSGRVSQETSSCRSFSISRPRRMIRADESDWRFRSSTRSRPEANSLVSFRAFVVKGCQTPRERRRSRFKATAKARWQIET